jgi:hypothetical protein
MKGKLGPLGLPKLFGAQGRRPAHRALDHPGHRKKFRASASTRRSSAYLYAKMNAAGKRLGLEGGELSWTLEDNAPVNTGIKLMGGKVYKTYGCTRRA